MLLLLLLLLLLFLQLNVVPCSTEKMFEDLDEDTQQKILPLKTVNRNKTEFIDGGAVMNEAGIRRLDDMEAK